MADKLAKILEVEGYDSVEDLLQACITASVAPAICMNGGRDYTCEMERDQDRGWCPECGQNSMQSAPILAGLI